MKNRRSNFICNIAWCLHPLSVLTLVDPAWSDMSIKQIYSWPIPFFKLFDIMIWDYDCDIFDGIISKLSTRSDWEGNSLAVETAKVNREEKLLNISWLKKMFRDCVCIGVFLGPALVEPGGIASKVSEAKVTFQPRRLRPPFIYSLCWWHTLVWSAGSRPKHTTVNLKQLGLASHTALYSASSVATYIHNCGISTFPVRCFHTCVKRQIRLPVSAVCTSKSQINASIDNSRAVK